jgi:hypothetical protein
MNLILAQAPAPSPQAPARRDNPFATCWIKPGALPFRFASGESAGQLVARLAAQNWRGAIVGPHGSGKSTLVEALKPAIAAAGRSPLAITLRDGQRRLPSDFLWRVGQTCVPAARQECPLQELGLVVIDGYEQLSWWERLRLAHGCRRAGVGLLVTAHKHTRIPTLIELAPDLGLVRQLVADLSTNVSASITPNDIAASHACHGSNVREIFFDLYDRHEQRRRAVRN